MNVISRLRRLGVVHSFHRPDVSRRATNIESVPDF